uniref:ATP synthase complex subunit 8 n=1 Tax=Tapinoma melanocephalum TaxID=219810 RepID=A0A6B9VFR1_9HYME|nr:ATP synthase F0 subunit 8 [Tapinoma melanocephalum]
MPQMMPMLWFLIFLLTLTIFLTLYMMINFYKLYHLNQSQKLTSLHSKSWNWKW